MRKLCLRTSNQGILMKVCIEIPLHVGSNSNILSFFPRNPSVRNYCQMHIYLCITSWESQVKGLSLVSDIIDHFWNIANGYFICPFSLFFIFFTAKFISLNFQTPSDFQVMTFAKPSDISSFWSLLCLFRIYRLVGLHRWLKNQ